MSFTLDFNTEIFINENNELTIQLPDGSKKLVIINGIGEMEEAVTSINGGDIFLPDDKAFLFDDGSGVCKYGYISSDGSSISPLLTVENADGSYLHLTGGILDGDLAFQRDGQGVKFMSGGQLYKKVGSGMVLKLTAGNTAFKIENNDGSNVRDNVDTVNGAALYLTKNADSTITSSISINGIEDKGFYFGSGSYQPGICLERGGTGNITIRKNRNNDQPTICSNNRSEYNEIVDTKLGAELYLSKEDAGNDYKIATYVGTMGGLMYIARYPVSETAFTRIQGIVRRTDPAYGTAFIEFKVYTRGMPTTPDISSWNIQIISSAGFGFGIGLAKTIRIYTLDGTDVGIGIDSANAGIGTTVFQCEPTFTSGVTYPMTGYDGGQLIANVNW